jgi:tetratricopeptide (TPR) repeat protein
VAIHTTHPFPADGHPPDALPAVLGAEEYDVFVSYSRRDQAIAEALYRGLPRYRPPRSLDGVPRRPLRVFRDVHDIVGTVLEESIRRHLDCSARLVVLCSPAARASRYVDAEIRHFAASRGPRHIVPVLVDGAPDAEAREEGERAFPDALLAALGNDPLAVDYRGFRPGRDRVTRGRFRPAWFQLLANLHGVPQRELEARERARVRRQVAAVAAILLLVVAAASAWTLYTRTDAYQLRRIVAAAPGLISQAEDTTVTAWLDALVAAGRYEDAMAHAGAIDGTAWRASVLAGLVPKFVDAGRPRAAAEAAREALAAAEATTVAQDRARALSAAAVALARVGDAAAAERAVAGALEAAQAPFTPADMEDFRDGPLAVVARAAAEVGQVDVALEAALAIRELNDVSRSGTLAEVATRLAAGGRRSDALRVAEVALGELKGPWGLWSASGMLIRIGLPERALEAARGIDSREVRARALGDVAAELARAGDGQARTPAREALAAGVAIPDPRARATTLAELASQMSDSGERDVALEMAREAVRAAPAELSRFTVPDVNGRAVPWSPAAYEPNLGWPDHLDDPLRTSALLLAEAGETDRALAAARLMGIPPDRSVLRRDIARVRARAGDAAGALAALRAIDFGWAGGPGDYALAALALSEAGNPAGAAEVVRDGYAGISTPGESPGAQPLAVLAATFARLGLAEEAVRVTSEALAAANRLGVEDPDSLVASSMLEGMPDQEAEPVRAALIAAWARSGARPGIDLTRMARPKEPDEVVSGILSQLRSVTAGIRQVETLRQSADEVRAGGNVAVAARFAVSLDSIAPGLYDPSLRSETLAMAGGLRARAGRLRDARLTAEREAVLPDDRLQVYTAIIRARPSRVR